MDLHIDDVADLPQVDRSTALDSAALERVAAANGAVGVEVGPVQIQRPANEFFFDPMGKALVSLGWSVFPQERGDRRGPSLVDGRPLRWKPYADRLPTLDEAHWWGLNAPSANVAAIMGPASGGAFCLDIDIGDGPLCAAAQDLADGIFGATEFRRVGRAPRVALLYRQDVSLALQAQVRSRAYRFVDGVDENGLPREIGGIEVLATGKPITFYGNHHKTGRYFSWAGLHPLYWGPEHLPLVTAEQVAEFIESVQRLRPFARAGRILDVDTRWTFDPDSGLHAPRAVTGDEWTTNDEGLVDDGRAGFLFHLARAVVRSNEVAARGDRAGHQALCALVEERFRALAVVDGRWVEDLRQQIAGVVSRCVAFALDKAATGRYFRSPTSIDPEAGVSYFPEDVPVEVQAEKAPDLAWVAKAAEAALTKAGQKKLPPMAVIPATEESKVAAALMPREERQAAGQQVSDAVQAFVRQALSFGYDVKARGGWQAGDGPMPLHALVAPTGAGKTVAVVRAVIALRRENPGTKVCVGVQVPSHANAVEVAAAVERELDEAAAMAEAAGLVVLHFKGRVTSGCGYAEQMEMLYAADLPGNRLCKTNNKERVPGEPEPVKVMRLCPLYEGCAYRRQLAALKAGEVDLVLLPHSTISGFLPEELLDALDIRVTDESPWKSIVGVATVPERVLLAARPEPAILKKEREIRLNDQDKVIPGLTPQELIKDRDDAVRILLDAGHKKVDPAEIFAALVTRNGKPAVPAAKLQRRVGGGGLKGRVKITAEQDAHLGLELIRHARRCASSSYQAGAVVQPDMSVEDVRKLLERPSTEAAGAEAAMWSVIADRVETILADRKAAGTHAAMVAVGSDMPPPPPKAKGARDRRIQFRLTDKGEPGVRVSWRKRQNWSHLPTLLIDASLSERITRKLWPDRDIQIHRVDAALALRTILVADGTGSDSSILSCKGVSGEQRLGSSARMDMWLGGIARMEGLYANSGVLLSSSKSVRIEAQPLYTPGPRTEWLHFGNSRGYDFAKLFGALYSYGRMEVPPAAIDGYAAAFTYDDDEPEDPFDLFGDGMQECGKKPLQAPKGVRRILMRDGTHREYEDLMYADGSWAREVQSQLREEELRQTVGRLRPVFRVDSEAVWVNVSRCVPEGIVVDEIISLGDFVRPGAGRVDHIFEAARRMHGVIATNVVLQDHPDLMPYRLGQPQPEQSLTDREREGLVLVRYRIEGYERLVERFVLNSHDDLEAAILQFHARMSRIVPGSVQVVGARPARVNVGRKKPDKVDRALSTIPPKIQDAILAEEDGEMLLRDAIRREGHRQEAAARARSTANVTRELGRAPTDWHALPAAKGIPRSVAKVRLSQRVILDRAAELAGDLDVTPGDGEP